MCGLCNLFGFGRNRGCRCGNVGSAANCCRCVCRWVCNNEEALFPTPRARYSGRAERQRTCGRI